MDLRLVAGGGFEPPTVGLWAQLTESNGLRRRKELEPIGIVIALALPFLDAWPFASFGVHGRVRLRGKTRLSSAFIFFSVEQIGHFFENFGLEEE